MKGNWTEVRAGDTGAEETRLITEGVMWFRVRLPNGGVIDLMVEDNGRLAVRALNGRLEIQPNVANEITVAVVERHG